MLCLLKIQKTRFVAHGTGNKSYFKYFKSCMFAFPSYEMFSENPCHTPYLTVS